MIYLPSDLNLWFCRSLVYILRALFDKIYENGWIDSNSDTNQLSIAQPIICKESVLLIDRISKKSQPMTYLAWSYHIPFQKINIIIPQVALIQMLLWLVANIQTTLHHVDQYGKCVQSLMQHKRSNRIDNSSRDTHLYDTCQVPTIWPPFLGCSHKDPICFTCHQ